MTQTLFCFFFQFLKCTLPFSLSPVDDVQVSCYRILNSLYFLGTNKSIYVERYNMSDTPALIVWRDMFRLNLNVMNALMQNPCPTIFDMIKGRSVTPVDKG